MWQAETDTEQLSALPATAMGRIHGEILLECGISMTTAACLCSLHTVANIDLLD